MTNLNNAAADIDRTWSSPDAARMWLKRNPRPGFKAAFDPDATVYRLIPAEAPAEAPSAATQAITEAKAYADAVAAGAPIEAPAAAPADDKPTPIDIFGEAAELHAMAKAKAPAKALTGARGRVAAAKGAAAKAPAKAPAKAAPKAPAGPAPAYRGIWAEAAEAAAKGKLPPAPDFTADTHKPYRAKLAMLVGLAKAGDAKGLAAVVINPTSSSPKALARYRDLVLVALRAKARA